MYFFPLLFFCLSMTIFVFSLIIYFISSNGDMHHDSYCPFSTFFSIRFFFSLASLKPINKWMLCLAMRFVWCVIVFWFDENEEPWMQPPWILDWLQKVCLKSIFLPLLFLASYHISRWVLRWCHFTKRQTNATKTCKNGTIHSHIHTRIKKVEIAANIRNMKSFLVQHVHIKNDKPPDIYTKLYLIMMLTKKLQVKQVNERAKKKYRKEFAHKKMWCTIIRSRLCYLLGILKKRRRMNDEIKKNRCFFYALFGKMPAYVSCMHPHPIAMFLALERNG